MEKLEVKTVTLRADGVLEVHTNITDNLELAKHVDKAKMEKCLNSHPFEFHLYQHEEMINSMMYEGRLIPFKLSEFHEFIKAKALSK